MKKTTFLFFVMATIFFFFSCVESSNKEENNKTTDFVTTSAGCNCEADWFPHNKTPAPAEGNGSPFDTSSTTNCIFHQWSWQKFLWLTKPVASGRPLFLDSMIQVDNHMEPIVISGNVVMLEDSTQAGSSGILMSNASYSADKNSHTVYYGIYINGILKNAADSMKNAIIKNTALVNNKFTFPVGSLELKTSWIDINALPTAVAATYYTTDAVLMPSGKKIKVALLGMHVVGVVKNHPEFIWATFEHHDMAPEYDWKATNNADVAVTSSNDKLFFQKGYNASWKDLQWNAASPVAQNVFTVYKYGIPVIAKDSFMNVSQSEPINHDNIVGLNSCVAKGLNDVWQNYSYNGSIWINMDGLSPAQQADTITSLGYNIGVALPGSIARGSTACFNITMETFVQSDTTMTQMNANSLTNCLSCHSSPAGITINGKQLSGNSPLYLSHIFRSYLSKSTGSTKPQIELMRIKDFMDMIQKKKLELKK